MTFSLSDVTDLPSIYVVNTKDCNVSVCFSLTTAKLLSNYRRTSDSASIPRIDGTGDTGGLTNQIVPLTSLQLSLFTKANQAK